MISNYWNFEGHFKNLFEFTDIEEISFIIERKVMKTYIKRSVIIWFFSTELFGQSNTCISQLQGPATFDIASCQQLEIDNLRFSKDSRIDSLKGLDRASKAKILGNYKGQLVEGKIVSSEIFDKQFPKSKGLLNGQKIKLYLYPGQKLACEEIEGKRLEGKFQQICCNGRLEAPCLLDTEYTMAEAKVLGSSGSRAGNEDREKSIRSKNYVAGMKAFQKRNYKKAAEFLEKSRSEGKIDLAGQYALGVSYRKLDLCPKGIPVLKDIYDEFLKKKNWADQDRFTRKAIFLLARCYSKELDSGQAVLILNGYLVESKKYKPEIRQSLKHPDFGWIHTTKDYVTYKKDALKKLKN